MYNERMGKKRISPLKQLIRSRLGATSIEYAMIAVFVSILAIAGFTAVANNMSSNYYSLFDAIPR